MVQKTNAETPRGAGLHDRLPAHAVYCLEFGVVCFGIGLSISLAKSGGLKRMNQSLATWLGFVPSAGDPTE